MQKYKATYKDLDQDKISEEYYVFLCNAEVINQIDYDEHCSRLHGIMPSELIKEQNIRVDSKIPFKLESALDIENVGPDDHDSILGTWFFKGVTSAILSKCSSKEQTDVNADRSRELVNEIVSVTTKNFSNLFTCKLREDVGDIEYSFTAKWSQIEKAFYAALGPDQVVSRYSKFIAEGATSFGGKPIEQIISDISNQISKCFGRD